MVETIWVWWSPQSAASFRLVKTKAPHNGELTNGRGADTNRFGLQSETHDREQSSGGLELILFEKTDLVPVEQQHVSEHRWVGPHNAPANLTGIWNSK